MAKEARQSSAGVTPPAGMNDNQPLSQDPNYFYLHGVHSTSQQYLQRMGGKTLINYFSSPALIVEPTGIGDPVTGIGIPDPILNIHGDQIGRIFVETVSTLYMFYKITDPLP